MRYIIAFLLALMLFGCAQPSASADGAGESQTDEELVPLEAAPEEGTISQAELATHSDESSCWVLYEGEVYDITAFLPNHPNESEVLRPHCGKDTFAQAFEGQHGMGKVDKLKQEGILMGAYGG